MGQLRGNMAHLGGNHGSDLEFLEVPMEGLGLAVWAIGTSLAPEHISMAHHIPGSHTHHSTIPVWAQCSQYDVSLSHRSSIMILVWAQCSSMSTNDPSTMPV